MLVVAEGVEPSPEQCESPVLPLDQATEVSVSGFEPPVSSPPDLRFGQAKLHADGKCVGKSGAPHPLSRATLNHRC